MYGLQFALNVSGRASERADARTEEGPTVPSVFLEVHVDERQLCAPVGCRHGVQHPFPMLPDRIVFGISEQSDVRQLQVRL